MAPPPGTLRVGRYFLALFLLLGVLYTIVVLPGTRNTPKLGIDLVGGVRVIFTAKPPPGKAVTQTSLEQARQIIEDRINGSGVTASTVQVQGDDQLVVSIPGGTDTDVARLGQAAQLNFRPVIAPAQLLTCNPSKKATAGSTSTAPSAGASSKPSAAASKSPTTSPSGSEAPNAVRQRPLTAPSTTPKTPPKTPSGSTSRSTAPAGTTPAAPPSASRPRAAPACVKNPLATLMKADPLLKVPTTEQGFAALGQQQQQEIAAALQNFDCNSATEQVDDAKKYYVACDDGKTYGGVVAYLLGTVIVPGRQIDEATAVAPSTGGQGGSTEWTVSLKLKGAGDAAWSRWTTQHNTNKSQSANVMQCSAKTTPCNDFVAFTLDGQVVSAPATNEPIVGQATQISGSFQQSSANRLADQLKFGALPLSFQTDSNERVSASLGTSQLQAALLAGGIGLVLVVFYSLMYYRGLGLVTIASLLVSALLTYAMMVILGEQIGFTLDLSGIAGLIVALGITADSFVVFFERIKDEVHEGRSVRVAVPRAWVRARRTILSADTVSFLAAAILYYFASADVKGFAFTLGLSTILDLVVVFLFTHPIVSLLSRSRAFGSPRFTGLNSVRPGGIAVERDAPRGKRAGAARSTGKPGRSAVALAKRAAEVETDDVEADQVDDLPRDDVVIEDAGTVDDPDPTETADEARVRRRTAPEPGTAAERAAARRARQRATKDDGGTS